MVFGTCDIIEIIFNECNLEPFDLNFQINSMSFRSRIRLFIIIFNLFSCLCYLFCFDTVHLLSFIAARPAVPIMQNVNQFQQQPR